MAHPMQNTKRSNHLRSATSQAAGHAPLTKWRAGGVSDPYFSSTLDKISQQCTKTQIMRIALFFGFRDRTHLRRCLCSETFVGRTTLEMSRGNPQHSRTSWLVISEQRIARENERPLKRVARLCEFHQMMTAEGSESPRSEQSETEKWEVVGHSSQSGDAHFIAPAGELERVCMIL
jgi:hypothetical protein